ncbi:Hypothetical predicted protein, partial [Mytilus galloprovincialis]
TICTLKNKRKGSRRSKPNKDVSSGGTATESPAHRIVNLMDHRIGTCTILNHELNSNE